MTHELKCWPVYFNAILSGRKKFELRKDDRNFKEGDILLLKEWCPDELKYTGRWTRIIVKYILRGPGFGLERGYVIMGTI